MRVAFVATEIGLQEGGAYMGGTVNNIVTIGEHLATRGHEIIIITTPPRDASENPMGEINWATVHEYQPPFHHGTPGYFASFCIYAVYTCKLLDRRDELDIVTVHAGYPQWGLIGGIVATTTSCHAVHVQYCPVDQTSGVYLYDATSKPWLIRTYLSSVDVLVGVSENVSDSLTRVSSKYDCRVVYPAIDTDLYSPDAAKRVDDSENYISYLGSLNPQKGLDILVKAFEEVRKDYDVKLKLGLEVRSERSNSPLAKRIRANPAVEVNGIIDDVPAFLAGSAGFVLPFRTTMGPADYPIAALEAMACRVPVVSTNVGGLQQLIEKSGGGTCVGDPAPENIESGLRSLLEHDQKWADRARSAREFAVESCSVPVVVNQFEEIIQKP